MKYKIAKQEAVYKSVIDRIVYTNCTDQKKGHSYNWLRPGSVTEIEIIKERPMFKGHLIAICEKCRKIQIST